MTPEIQTALDNCRTAFNAHPEATWAWCCHHEVEVEPLTEPFENRIQFMLENKDDEELVTRFNNFRPVLSVLPERLLKAGAEYNKALAEYDKVGAEYNKALAEYYKARAEYDKAWAKYNKAGAELDKARAELDKARAELKNELAPLHKADVPNHTWNGHSIF